MAYSQATMVKRVRQEMQDNPWFDTITNSPTTTGTTISVADTTKYAVGTVIEFQTDGDLALVTAVASGTNLTVIRNYMYAVGTTAGTGTAHTSGEQIAANPKFRYVDITECISTVLSELYPHVYRITQKSVTPVSGKTWYDLADTTILDISSVVQEVGTSGATSSQIFQYGHDAFYMVSLQQGLPTAKIATGPGLYIKNLRDVNNTIYVNAIAQIDDTIGTGSYTYITGNDEANTVIYLTAAKLVGTTEIQRLTQEDVTMGDASVQPGMRRNLSQYLEAKGLQERRRWEAKLRQKYPTLPISRGRSS